MTTYEGQCTPSIDFATAVGYYTAGGNDYSNQCATLGVRESRSIEPWPSWLSGTSAATADKNISTVVTNTDSFGSEAYAYSGIPSIPSASGVGTGKEVFVPCHLYGYYGWSSEIYVQNPNPATTYACALFYPDSGGNSTRTCDNINSGGRQTFSFTNAISGSVRVTATLPVGVVVRHKHSSIDDMAYNGIVSGTTAAYLPSLFKNYYSTWYSSYQVQETTGNPVNVHVYYYPPSPPYYYKEIDLAARGHKEVYLGNEPLPDGWRGSARVVVVKEVGRWPQRSSMPVARSAWDITGSGQERGI